MHIAAYDESLNDRQQARLCLETFWILSFDIDQQRGNFVWQVLTLFKKIVLPYHSQVRITWYFCEYACINTPSSL